MNLDHARAIADAVMMEGYALYPYRASAPKNRYRWTFGVLAPRAWSETGGCEAWWLEAQVLVAGAPERIAGQLRFFQIERRADRWDEGIVRTVDFEVPAHEGATSFAFDAEVSPDRERRALTGRIAMRREPVAAERPLVRVTIRVENTTPWQDAGAPRDRAIASAFASTHLVLGVTRGELISAIDPPAWAMAPAAACTSVRTYPVLVGPPGSQDLALAAPFIMYDHPQLAPESTGDLCDATEIDELLLLRTRTLTDDEKREARATDPRAAQIVDRAEALADGAFARLHGTSRAIAAGEMVPKPERPGVGSKVVLRTPKRRTDAQDLLYAGHTATVVDVKQDVDGTTFFAVTIDDDPAAELHDWYGRYHYYRSDEVELL